ncbi:hypothetical protein BN946_scf185010.g19 [Trametes cinnabarina]|uniref:Uncharacterized protein n=1 Tax=Pycnoporus cinnabarinus TaxID=5643 RepID=A0A060SS89_PYCCI|nr:hypothetical protein BN946_scf185010.g19 [Trametes cinnabarina]
MLDPDSLSHLSRLPTLTTLALENDRTALSYPPRSEIETPAFPALKELLISTGSPSGPNALAFIEHIGPTSIDAVTIFWDFLYVRVHESGDMLADLLTRMGDLEQLRHIRVVLEESIERIVTDLRPSSGFIRGLKTLCDSGEYLEPALSIASLRTLEISTEIIFQVDNSFLSAIARSLPRLESLSLVPTLQLDFSLHLFEQDEVDTGEDRMYLVRRLLPTLDGLLPLVDNCPRLSNLRIAVESTISIGGPSRDRGTRAVKRGSWWCLELWATGLDPRLSDDVFVAFFTDNFPELENMRVRLPRDPYGDAEVHSGTILGASQSRDAVHVDVIDVAVYQTLNHNMRNSEVQALGWVPDFKHANPTANVARLQREREHARC